MQDKSRNNLNDFPSPSLVLKEIDGNYSYGEFEKFSTDNDGSYGKIALKISNMLYVVSLSYHNLYSFGY